EDYGVHYAGRLEGGSLTDVAIGLDLIRASLAVEGSLDEVKARGVGRVGPYAGKIDFVSDLKGAHAGRRTVELDGGFSVAGMVSGEGPGGPPFRARLTTK